MHSSSRKWRNVSGFLHPHDENWRQLQAVCTFCAPHSRKLRHVSGGLHAYDVFADSLRLCALFEHPIHENCRTSQAPCTPMTKPYDSLRLGAVQSPQLWNASGFLHPHDENWPPSQAHCAFYAPHSRKLRHVSGGLHAHDAFADSFRLFALFEHPIHENCRTSQAPCAPMMKPYDSLRL